MVSRVVSVLLLSAVCTGRGLAQEGSDADSPFGMHPAHVVKAGYLQAAYADAQTMGVKWHRPSKYLAWIEVQRDLNNPEFDFSFYDRYYGEAPSGICILANIVPEGKTTSFYTLPNSHLPIDEAKYIAFVKAAVERYDGDGVNDMPGLKNPILYWQVGNEANDRDGKKDFAKFQKMTYAAIKEACPECKVLVGGAAQPILPGQGFTTSKDDYFTEFSTSYEPILRELNGGGFDIFDFHWYGNATGDYKLMKPVYEQLRLILEKYSFRNVPIWITEMGSYSGFPSGDRAPDGTAFFAYQTELQQASDYLKRFVFSLSLGLQKIFPAFGLIEGFKDNDGYFDHTGFLYDGGGSNDLELGVKKLSYYAYKKMVEILEGSDVDNIQTIQEQDGIYIYKFTKQGKPVWIAWNDSGDTRTITISGITSDRVKMTEAVPEYESGKDVVDYATAFRTDTLAATNGAVTLTLGARPVFVELLTASSMARSWPVCRGNPQHTGQASVLGPQTPDVVWKYRYSSGGKVGDFPKSFVVDRDGRVYTNSMGTLLSFSSGGNVLWERRLGAGGAVALSPNEKTIYSVARTKLYAFTTAGEQKWVLDVAKGDIHGEPNVASDSTVYVGSGDTYVYAIDPVGTIKWKFKTDGSIAPLASPTLSLDEKIVYVGSGDPNNDPGGTVYALRAEDGGLLWSKNVDGMRASGVLVGPDGTLYVNGRRSVHRLNANGETLWTSPGGTASSLAPSLGSDGTVYVGTGEEGKIYALDGQTGAIKWSYQTAQNPHYLPGSKDEPQYGVLTALVLGSDGVVYAGTMGNRFYALRSNGTVLWELGVGDNVDETCPALSPDGTLYFSAADGYIYAVRGSITSVDAESESLPKEFILYQNYPNPFNPITTIRFVIPQRSHVTLKVFDILGREVATLVERELNTGEHSIVYNAKDLSSRVSSKGASPPLESLNRGWRGYASGVYFYRLSSASFVYTKKMLIIQ